MKFKKLFSTICSATLLLNMFTPSHSAMGVPAQKIAIIETKADNVCPLKDFWKNAQECSVNKGRKTDLQPYAHNTLMGGFFDALSSGNRARDTSFMEVADIVCVCVDLKWTKQQLSSAIKNCYNHYKEYIKNPNVKHVIVGINFHEVCSDSSQSENISEEKTQLLNNSIKDLINSEAIEDKEYNVQLVSGIDLENVNRFFEKILPKPPEVVVPKTPQKSPNKRNIDNEAIPAPSFDDENAKEKQEEEETNQNETGKEQQNAEQNEKPAKKKNSNKKWWIAGGGGGTAALLAVLSAWNKEKILSIFTKNTSNNQKQTQPQQPTQKPAPSKKPVPPKNQASKRGNKNKK